MMEEGGRQGVTLTLSYPHPLTPLAALLAGQQVREISFAGLNAQSAPYFVSLELFTIRTNSGAPQGTIQGSFRWGSWA